VAGEAGIDVAAGGEDSAEQRELSQVGQPVTGRWCFCWSLTGSGKTTCAKRRLEPAGAVRSWENDLVYTGDLDAICPTRESESEQ